MPSLRDLLPNTIPRLFESVLIFDGYLKTTDHDMAATKVGFGTTVKFLEMASDNGPNNNTLIADCSVR